MSRRFLLLDRDGTLIEEKHYLSDPAGVELIPGAADALARFRGAGWGIAVLTNQAGIGRGLYGIEQMEAVNRRVADLLAASGVVIDGFFACPHHPDADCECRKPRTGMVEQARSEFGFDPVDAVVVGDKACDMALADNVGATSVLVRTGYGRQEEPQLAPDFVIDSLADLASVVDLTAARDPISIMEPNWNDFAVAHLTESIEVKRRTIEQCVGPLVEAAAVLASAFRGGHKLLICGNGGSAADSQHLATEFVSTLTMAYERPALPAIALTTDTSALTAIANDYGFDRVFARQVEALGSPGDVLIGISTSGNSAVVVEAVDMARSRGLKTIGLLGGDGGKLRPLVDHAIVVPDRTTMHIQESHLAIYHILVAIVERTLYPK